MNRRQARLCCANATLRIRYGRCPPRPFVFDSDGPGRTAKAHQRERRESITQERDPRTARRKRLAPNTTPTARLRGEVRDPRTHTGCRSRADCADLARVGTVAGRWL